MIEQEKRGLLYTVNLNKSSFEQNPGRFNLPKGRYVVEIRDGTFNYQSGYSVDVEVKYFKDGKKQKIKFPDLGIYKNRESALDIYLGMSIEFDHDGGDVEIYNPKPSRQWFGRMDGNCIVGVWDGKMFGSPFGVFEPQECKPEKDILILTNDPESKPYQIIGDNITWQSDLKDYGKYKTLIFTPESYSFLHKIRDNNCIEPYIKSGGNIYFSGFSPRYLSYYNVLPFECPRHISVGEFNSVATFIGDSIVSGGEDHIKFQTSLTVLALNNKEDCVANLQSFDSDIDDKWCVMSKKENDSGSKIVWSSFFIMEYDNTEKWNNLVLDQIGWLLK